MEEIKIDFQNINISPQDLAFINYMTNEAVTKGTQVGIPWKEEVYKYLFETSSLIDYAKIFGYQDNLV